jgi:hypothetical protein
LVTETLKLTALVSYSSPSSSISGKLSCGAAGRGGKRPVKRGRLACPA